MGAGDVLPGDGLAGDDDVDMSTETRRQRPAAFHFDGTTRDFPMDADGRYIAIHPVDAKMQMACLVARHSIAGSPTTGNGLIGDEYLDPNRIDARVKDEVRRATKTLVDAGDVTIEGIAFDASDGRLVVACDYYNERLPGRPRKSTSA